MLKARIGMVPQVLVQVWMAPDEIRIIDQRGILAELARKIRMVVHEAVEAGVPTENLRRGCRGYDERLA